MNCFSFRKRSFFFSFFLPFQIWKGWSFLLSLSYLWAYLLSSTIFFSFLSSLTHPFFLSPMSTSSPSSSHVSRLFTALSFLSCLTDPTRLTDFRIPLISFLPLIRSNLKEDAYEPVPLRMNSYVDPFCSDLPTSLDNQTVPFTTWITRLSQTELKPFQHHLPSLCLIQERHQPSILSHHVQMTQYPSPRVAFRTFNRLPHQPLGNLLSFLYPLLPLLLSLSILTIRMFQSGMMLPLIHPAIHMVSVMTSRSNVLTLKSW